MSNLNGDATRKVRVHGDIGGRRTTQGGILAGSAVSAPRIVAPRSGIELVNLFDPEVRANEHPLSDVLRKWATEYLCEPHENLGRTGPVCPFTGPSIAHRHFWAGFIDGTDIDQDRMKAVADDLFEIFPDLPPTTGADSTLKAVLAVFPDITDFGIIDRVQDEGKANFVKEGLMLGQFYPGCTVSGLRNKDFYALDAPLPMLAVRRMVGSDFPFLVSRRDWILSYLKEFAPTVPFAVRSSIADKLVSTAD